MHVAAADAAYCLGEGPSVQSYLCIEKIIEAAKILEADAVHPGYGFLSENASFAQACFEAGLVWIGPSPESIRAMGDKTIAKTLVTKAGVPCSPGKNEPLASLGELEALAREIGFPLILKAAAGGGGRGMKVVRSELELKGSFEACQREALAYFANGDVFCERFIENPRHVEVQIVGDRHGNMVHLFDRDCTIQRRHQKLFEEAPSSFISEETRREMGNIAIKAAKQVGYCSAGTVEFLLESPTKYYFMEMNTRIQVEHPVSEEITGIDLVALQFRVARGEDLGISQKDIHIRGWACEARINAEDPYQGFRPGPGRINAVRFPGGPGVRVESHLYPGYAIPEFYDSMIAKLITTGANRTEALNRMARALGEFEIDGVPTTVPFHQALLRNPVFRSGIYTTKFLEMHPDLMTEELDDHSETKDSSPASLPSAADLLAIATAIHCTLPTAAPSTASASTRGSSVDHHQQDSPWAAAHRNAATRQN
jgi:acetyl-CoA carboxylase biotin carboxylase subunit